MSGVNKCIFIGNAGRDAELRSTASGVPVANVSIGVNSRIGGEEVTEWVNLVFWDKLAEVAADYIVKGKMIYVEARMQTRKWQDKDGNDKYSPEFHVQQLQLLGGGEDGGGRGDDRGRAPQRGRGDDRDDRGGRDTRTHGEQRRERTSGYRDEPPARRPPERGGRDAAPPPRRQQPKSNTGFDDMDSDIPF